MTNGRPVRIDLGYHGGRFSGSQRQSGVRTVQAELESALFQVTRRGTTLVFAGRTDRGVHAVGQVASGRVNWNGDLERLRYALDSVTDDDLVVYRVADCDETFHARFSAVSREYRYRVFVGDHAPVLLRGLVYWVRNRPDLDAMEQAAGMLEGNRDFRSFAGRGVGSNTSDEETRRTVELATWSRVQSELEPRGELCEFRIRANAYLPHMVRNIVGALLEVGQGRADVRWIETLLELRDRRQAPPPAPAEGLTLWRVEYEEQTEPANSAGMEQE